MHENTSSWQLIKKKVAAWRTLWGQLQLTRRRSVAWSRRSPWKATGGRFRKSSRSQCHRIIAKTYGKILEKEISRLNIPGSMFSSFFFWAKPRHRITARQVKRWWPEFQVPEGPKKHMVIWAVFNISCLGCFHFNLVSPLSFYRVWVSVHQTHVPWPTILS